MKTTIQLKWIKCTSDKWCPFTTLNLKNEHFDKLNGVYVIWSFEDGVIRVGQGQIRERITDHREDSKINNFEILYVTWAEVDKDNMDGVEKFLADSYKPIVGERFPDSTPTPVNLPIPVDLPE